MFYSSDIDELLENYQEIKINVEIADQSSLKELSKLRELYEMLNIEKDSKKMEIRSSSKYKDFKKNKVWFFSIDVNGKELNYVLNNSFPIFINEKSIKTRKSFEYLFVEEEPYILYKKDFLKIDEQFLKIVNFLESKKENQSVKEIQEISDKMLRINDLIKEGEITKEQLEFFNEEYNLEAKIQMVSKLSSNKSQNQKESQASTHSLKK